MTTTQPRALNPALIALSAVGAVGVACSVWSIGIERYLFTVREATAPALPAGSAPIRVLHISDAHMAPWQRRSRLGWRRSPTSNPI